MRSSSRDRIRSRSRSKDNTEQKTFGKALSEGDNEAEDAAECEFAMKMMHKPTLSRERAIRYDTTGQYEIINNLEKVYLEIEIWT